MPNVGPAEILVILVVALLIFGPDKLPEIGRQIGRATREFRRMQASLRDEVRDVLEPPAQAAQPPTLPAGETPGPHEPPDADHADADRAIESGETGGAGDAGEGDAPEAVSPGIPTPSVETDRPEPTA